MVMIMNMAGSLDSEDKVMTSFAKAGMGNAKQVMSGVGNDVVWRVCWSLIVRLANGWKMV